MDNQEQVLVPEVIAENSLGTVIKAEIDMQIATAKAYPRSLKVFLDKTVSMATVTEDIATYIMRYDLITETMDIFGSLGKILKNQNTRTL